MKGECPLDGSPLAEIGSTGIIDADKRWDSEATRFRCEHGHMLFVADAAPIDTAEDETPNEVAIVDLDLDPTAKKFAEEVLKEYPPSGKYRIRLLKDPQLKTAVLDIREFISSETFEGFTRRGIRVANQGQAAVLLAALMDICATEALSS